MMEKTLEHTDSCMVKWCRVLYISSVFFDFVPSTAGAWFQIFFMFTPKPGEINNLTGIFFKWVKTTK